MALVYIAPYVARKIPTAWSLPQRTKYGQPNLCR